MPAGSTTKYLLRIAVSVVVFAVAFNQVQWPAVKDVFARLDSSWLAVHLLVLLFERLVFAYKWQILLVVKQLAVPFRALLSITLIGKFWGLFLPSSIGVDIVRGYYLFRKTDDAAVAVSSVLIDKVMSLWALLLMGLFGLMFHGAGIRGADLSAYLGGTLLATAAVVYVLQHEGIAGWWAKVLPRWFGARLAGALLKIYRSFLDYKQHLATLGYSFVLSIVFQLVRVAAVYAMAVALQIEIPPVYYFIMIPVSMLVIMLPISIGGLGLREGIFVALFAVAGMSTTDAFALGLALSMTDLLISLLGGGAYLVDRPLSSNR